MYQVGQHRHIANRHCGSNLQLYRLRFCPAFRTRPPAPQPRFLSVIWFADANTLYVCDEGDGTYVSPPVNGNVADPQSQATAGLQKWSLVNGTWTMLYVLQNGLNIGVPYSVRNYPAALDPATGGCRNITGRHNGDGTVTIYAITSTISANGDTGADPNKLVKVTDRVSDTTLPAGDGDNDRDDAIGHFVTHPLSASRRSVSAEWRSRRHSRDRGRRSLGSFAGNS